MKNKFIKLGVMSAALIALVSSCLGGAKEKAGNSLSPLSWDSVHCEKVLSLNNDTMRYETEQTFLFPTNDTTLYRLNAQRVFGDSVPNVEPDSLLTLHSLSLVPDEELERGSIKILDSVTASKERPETDYFNPNYTFFEENKLMYQDDVVVSIQYYNYVYLGGAHGMGSYSYLVYDRKSQSMVTEEDLFDEKDKGDFELLFAKQLVEKMKKEYETYDPEEPMWQSMENVKPNGNFYLTEHSLVYQFNHYEIGAYALGTPTLEIPYELIKNLIKKDSPIARIIEKRK